MVNHKRPSGSDIMYANDGIAISENGQFIYMRNTEWNKVKKSLRDALEINNGGSFPSSDSISSNQMRHINDECSIDG